MTLEVSKGHKDWAGRDAILRNTIRGKLSTVFEQYGYNPLETPVIEDKDALGFKGGGEIQKEVYQLTDQGERKLALRFDQTVPLARFVASTPDLKFPFKRYAMGPVFRDGPTQPEQGRYRSFWQCDVDVLGIKQMTAEAELLALAQDAFQDLGIGEVDFKINNRKLLDGVLDAAGVPNYAKIRTILTLDKLDKIGIDGVIKTLEDLSVQDEEKGVSDNVFYGLKTAFETNGQEEVIRVLHQLKTTVINQVGISGFKDLSQIIERENLDATSLIRNVSEYRTRGERLLNPANIKRLSELLLTKQENPLTYLASQIDSAKGTEGLAEVRQLLEYASALGFEVIFDPVLARGLDYYTGTTLEVFAKDRSRVSSAVLAGGRFDDMVGSFRGGDEIPAVGFSFGLERIAMLVGSDNAPPTSTQLYIIPVGTESACLRVAHELRRAGLNVDMELQGRRPKKALKTANDLGVPYVGLINEEELANKTMTLKYMRTGEQRIVPISEVADKIR